MKKFLSYLTIIMMAFAIASCSNNDEPQFNAVSENSDFEVITLSDSPVTRSTGEYSAKQILKFKDQAAFDRTLAQFIQTFG